MNNAVFRKTIECEKTQSYQTCNNWKKKELFSIRTKLPQNNFFENLLATEMEKAHTYE